MVFLECASAKVGRFDRYYLFVVVLMVRMKSTTKIDFAVVLTVVLGDNLFGFRMENLFI